MYAKINTAFVQFRPEIGEVDKNFAKVDELLTQLPPETELVVLPELAFTGYNFSTRESIEPFSERAEAGKTLKILQTQAQKHRIYIVAGFPELDGDSIYNSSMLVGAEGLVGTYRKVHLFDNEKKILAQGDDFTVFPLKLPKTGIELKLGILICFDWIFAESWLALFHQDADVIAHCTNLVLPGRAQKAVPAMSMMHRIPVILANRYGSEAQYPENNSENTLNFTGNSIITDASGKILVSAPENEDFIGSASLDLDDSRNKQITGLNNLISDRRPDVYRKFLNF